jgi:hypothetical protein
LGESFNMVRETRSGAKHASALSTIVEANKPARSKTSKTVLVIPSKRAPDNSQNKENEDVEPQPKRVAFVLGIRSMYNAELMLRRR